MSTINSFQAGYQKAKSGTEFHISCLVKVEIETLYAAIYRIDEINGPAMTCKALCYPHELEDWLSKN